MGETRADWRAGQLLFRDGTTQETVLPLAPIILYDDFLGGAINTDIWTEIDTADATVAIGGSVLTCHLHATGQTEDAGVYGKNDLSFNLDKGPIFECRLAVHTAPTEQAEIMFGVQAEAYGTGSNKIFFANEVNKYAAFGFYATLGVGLIPAIRTYDGTIDSGIISSGISAVALDAYHIYRIDFTDITNILFYIDGEGVAKTTTFDMNTGSNIMVQPIVMADKLTANTGVTDYYLDYVKIWQATR